MKGKITQHDFNSDTACIGLKLTRLGRRSAQRACIGTRSAIDARSWPECEVQEIQIIIKRGRKAAIDATAPIAALTNEIAQKRADPVISAIEQSTIAISRNTSEASNSVARCAAASVSRSSCCVSCWMPSASFRSWAALVAQ